MLFKSLLHFFRWKLHGWSVTMNNTSLVGHRIVDLYPAYVYFQIVFCVILFLSICSGNILTIITIQRKRTLAHRITSQLVLNLACADLLVGLTAPLHGVLFALDSKQIFTVFCLVQDAAATAATGISLYSLLLIAAERYMGICHPLHHQRWLTLHRIKLSIVTTWIYIIILVPCLYAFQKIELGMVCLMSAFLPIPVEVVVFANMFFVIVVSTALYGRMFYIAKTSHNKVILYRRGCTMDSPVASSSIHGNKKKPWQQTMKVNVVMAMVMGAFIVTWVPFMVMSILRVSLKLNTPEWIMAEESLMMLSTMNSSLNPLIYAWKFRDFRWAYRRAVLSPILRLRRLNGRGHES